MQVIARFITHPVDAHVIVVVDRPTAMYSGMVPGYIAGRYRLEELQIDVEALARRAGATPLVVPVVAIDPRARRLLLREGDPVPYDHASINIGSTVAGLDLPGVREHAIPTRPIAEFVRRIDALVASVPSREPGQPFRVVVVGGGAAGIEIAFSLRARLATPGGPAIAVQVLNAAPRIIEGYPDGLVRRVERHARARRIGIRNRTGVEALDAGRVLLSDGSGVAGDAVIWVTGAVSHPLFRASGLPTDGRGFVRTRSTLQVEGYDNLFAVGDCGTLDEYPRTPKAGVYAVRQGPLLTANLRAALARRPLSTYTPQAEFLTLLNLGDGRALGAKRGFSFEGRWVMRLKDSIDRRFMRRFRMP